MTRRITIPFNMTYVAGRRQYGYPVLVPPVHNKASIPHDSLHGVWAEAEKALGAA